MTDRLTPPMLPAWALRDLAKIFDSAVPCVTGHAFGALSTMRAICNSEAARREAEAKPQNGRGHIPLITCPGSTKSCMGYDCLDKGCLDGEPMASGGVSVPELRNSNISLGGCEVCTTPTACKQEKHCDHFDCEWTRAVPDDELGRASGETGPSPSPVTTGLPPQGEREGPGSAAAPNVWRRECPHSNVMCESPVCRECGCQAVRGEAAIVPEDKPAPADDLLMSNVDAFLCLPTAAKSVFEADNLLSRSKDRIEAQAREIAELKRLANSRLEFANQYAAQLGEAEARVRELERECGQWQEASGQANVRAEQLEDKWEAEKARADGLAAAIDRAVEELDAIEKAASANDPWDELQVRAADTAKKLRMAAALTEGGA